MLEHSLRPAAVEADLRDEVRMERGRSRWRAAGHGLAFLLVVEMLGCGDSATRVPSVRRDSSGVEIVTIDAKVPAPTSWTLKLLFRVGGREAVSATPIGHAADLVLDGSGGVYVLDQLRGQVSEFDARGRWLRSVGRRGAGPGELAVQANSLVLYRDSLIVGQGGVAAAAVIDRVTGRGRTLVLPALNGSRHWWREGPNGEIMVRALYRTIEKGGRWGGRDVVYRMAADSLDSIMAFKYKQSDFGGVRDLAVPLLPNQPAWAILSGGEIAWLHLESPEVRIHDWEKGGVDRRIRYGAWRQGAISGVIRAGLDSLLREKVSENGLDPSVVASLKLRYPDAWPAITNVITGPGSTLLVSRSRDVSHVRPASINSVDGVAGMSGPVWDVIGIDGSYLGEVTFPHDFMAMDARGKRICGISFDEVDREWLECFRMAQVG